MIFEVLFFSVLLPLLCALGFLAIGLNKGEDGRRATVSVGIAVVASFLAVYFWISGIPDMPPIGANGWLFIVAVDVAALAILEALVKQRVVIWGARFLIISLGLRMILDAKFQYGWSAEQGYIHVAVLTALGLAQWGSFERLSRRSGGPLFGLVVAGYAGLSAIILGLASSATLAQMTGAIAIAAVAAAVAAWKFKSLPFAALVSSVVPLVLMLTVISLVFADLPNIPFILVALVPFSAWLGELGPWRKNRFGRAAFHLVAIAVPVLTAAWMLVSTTTQVVTVPNQAPGEVDEAYDPYAADGADEAYDPYSVGDTDDAADPYAQ